MDPQILTQIGLTPEEAQIYLSLLENGAQTAISLGKTTKVKRTYVYRVAQNLVKKELVNIVKRGRTTYFEPGSPDHLLLLSQRQQQKALMAKEALEGLLPRLKSNYRLIEAKPVVTYFEGVEGIKKVYQDTLTEAEDILALVETTSVHPEIYEWVTAYYAKARVKAGIKVRAIVASGQKTKTYVRLNEAELRETKIVDSHKFPFQNEINIYGNKVSLIKHTKGGNLVGIIIDNEAIAATFRSWFELTWLQLED